MKPALLILLAFTGVTSVSCGAMMALEPTGSLLLLDLHWLQHTSFKNFSIPGLILIVVGVIQLFTWYNVKTNRKSGLWWAVAAGVLIIGYEAVQMLLLQMTYWLQYSYMAIGFFTILMALQLKHKELI